MSAKSKQAERNAQKRAAKKNTQEDEPAPVSGGTEGSFATLLERGKALLLDACIVTVLPKLPELMKEQPGQKKEEKKEEEKKEEESEEKKDDSSGEKADDSADAIFATLSSRLQWYNTLGLGEPKSSGDAKDVWLVMKDLELDSGPRKVRKGSPGIDRVLKNLCTYLPQYMHVLLALMCFRAFFFRSWFACLPWLVGYQAASLLVPVELTNSKDIPMKFRVAATAAFHVLVVLFFFYEFIWKLLPIIEHIFWVGLIVLHAYVAKPIGTK